MLGRISSVCISSALFTEETDVVVESNALAQVPADKQPQSRMVGPQIEIMERSVIELDAVLVKLVSLHIGSRRI